MSPSTSTHGNIEPSTFESLGVDTMINCGGTYTVISGSRMLDVAVEAMAEATNGYVRISELMEKVGQRLAELTGAEWGYITTSCSAAINQITAAAMAGGDPEKIARLPDTRGMKNEVIQERAIRSGYEQCMRIAGAEMVFVDTEADLRAAINEHTALIFIDGDAQSRSRITPQPMIDVADEFGVPCFVDAAAQRVEVPNRYLEMGADAVAYSGGKCLRGPQASGLVLGNKGLLRAAFLNASPHNVQGRAMKVGKEEIMGLLAAVEAFLLGRDHEAEWEMWEGYLKTIGQAVDDLPSVEMTYEEPGICNVTPYLHVTWDPDVLNGTPEEIREELLEGEPSIFVNATSEGLRFNPYMMEAGEDAIVAQRLREVMSDRPAPEPVAPSPPASVDVSGEWLIDLAFVFGGSTHSMNLIQEGATLTGTYRSQYGQCPIRGQVAGNEVSFQAVLPHGPSRTRYDYEGTVTGDTMSGSVSMGQEWPATWRARR
ncbi:MAG: PLP-dependent transferase, partial [Chloroflexota bacterium]